MNTLTKKRNFIFLFATAILSFIIALFSLRFSSVYADSNNSDYKHYFVDTSINEEDLNSQEITFYYKLESFDKYFTKQNEMFELEFKLFNYYFMTENDQKFAYSRRYKDEIEYYDYMRSLGGNTIRLGFEDSWEFYNTSYEFLSSQYLDTVKLKVLYYMSEPTCELKIDFTNYSELIRSVGFTTGKNDTKPFTIDKMSDISGYFFIKLDLNNITADYWESHSLINPNNINDKVDANFYITSYLNETEKEEFIASQSACYSDALANYYAKIESEGSDDQPLTDEELDRLYDEEVNGIFKQVTIEYLDRIGNSKFATKKEKTLITRVYKSGDLNIKYLESVWNYQTLKCFNTIVSSIEYNKLSGKYVVKYAKDCYLASKSVDGRTVNQFLDTNKSFAETYKPLVDKGYIPTDLYEWFLTQIKRTDTTLQSLTYNDTNIYGYFGWCVLPDTYSINALLSTVFNGDTQYRGELKQFTFKGTLDLSSYNSLLKDYNYPWFSRVWNDVNGFSWGYEANYVMLVCEPEVKNAVVSDSGSTDIDNNKGFLRNEIEKLIKPVKDMINSLNDNKNIVLYVLLGALGLIVVYKLFIKKDKGK